MFQIGEKFGDYEVLQILGAGGMGQVYKVRNILSDRFEAMKVLLPNLEQHADLADRFLREIKVQATLQHKNIAGLHTAQRQGDRILMFIEFVDGITLDKALQRGPLAPELAVNIIGQVLEALAYAHQRGIVHRDIKPENIMVQPDGVVKLMDFGIARLAQDRRLTSTGRTVGSLFYMSPEQIRGADDLDARSDLYSLGITLYQAVTGKRPFDGDSDYSIMSAHIQQSPVPPVQLDERVPQALNDVILMAIAKDRDARFQSADAFRNALQASVGSAAAAPVKTAPIPATMPMPAVAPVAPPPPPPPPPPAPVASVAPVAQKSSGVGKGLLLVAGVLAAAGVYYSSTSFLHSNSAVTPVVPEPAKQQQQQQEQLPKPSAPVTQPQTQSQPATEPAVVKPQPPPVAVDNKPPQQQQQQRPQTKPADPVVTATTPPQQQQQQPTEAPPQQQQQQAPAIDPQTQRELEELRQKFNTLNVRFSTARESVQHLEAQQQRQGLSMRRDVREGMQRFQYLMKDAADSITNRNTAAARTDLNMAERALDRLEKFLGN